MPCAKIAAISCDRAPQVSIDFSQYVNPSLPRARSFFANFLGCGRRDQGDESSVETFFALHLFLRMLFVSSTVGRRSIVTIVITCGLSFRELSFVATRHLPLQNLRQRSTHYAPPPLPLLCFSFLRVPYDFATWSLLKEGAFSGRHTLV